MEKAEKIQELYTENIQELYNQYKDQHRILDRRIQMLLRKPYLTEAEEREMKDLKKKKLYCKDLMESLADTE